MLPCGTCGNDVYEEFEHCYNQKGQGRSWGEWMRCKKCNTEIELDVFFTLLRDPEDRSGDAPIDGDGTAHKYVSGPQKTAICLSCPNAVFADFEPWHASMRCKTCQNVMGLDTFMYRLGVEDTARNKSHPAGGLTHISGQGNNSPLQGVIPEDLEDMWQLLFSWPCSKCGNAGEHNFTFIFNNDKDILGRSCDNCEELMGLDNGMTPDQINQLLTSGTIRVKTCACKNDDPNKMTLEQRGQEVVFVCSDCNRTNFSLGDFEVDQCCGSDIKLACKCGNKDSELFAVHSDAISGKPIRVTCLCCRPDAAAVAECPCCNTEPDHLGVESECNGTRVKRSSISQKEMKNCEDSTSGKTPILSPSELHPGDHVTWRRRWGYWHHAIVTDVGKDAVKVIEYGTNEEKSSLSPGTKAIIKERWHKVNFGKEPFYRIEYRDGQVYTQKEVIERARGRLGETSYGVFTNNCEQFATWAKTGCCKSDQVENFATYCRRLLKKGINEARDSVSSGIEELEAVLDTGIELGVEGVGEVAIDSIAVFIPSSLLLLLVEAGFVVKDVCGYYTKRENGDISGEQFKQLLIERVCRGLGGVAVGSLGGWGGGTVGALAGTALGGPIGGVIGFFLGKFVGQTVGYIIGSAAGHAVGGFIAW